MIEVAYIASVLKRASFFSSLSLKELQEIGPLFREEHFAKDQFIFFEGDPARYLYLVKEGKVKILKQSPSGKDIILEVTPPGEVFGGVGILAEEHPASAQAMEHSQILKISRRDFFSLFGRYPPLAVEVIVALGRRLRDAHTIIRGLASERVERRIARILLKLADRIGSPEAEEIKLNIHLTRQDIADMVGSTVETAIRVMSRFQKEGLIRSLKGRVLITNKERLTAIAEGLGSE